MLKGRKMRFRADSLCWKERAWVGHYLSAVHTHKKKSPKSWVDHDFVLFSSLHFLTRLKGFINNMDLGVWASNKLGWMDFVGEWLSWVRSLCMQTNRHTHGHCTVAIYSFQHFVLGQFVLAQNRWMSGPTCMVGL